MKELNKAWNKAQNEIIEGNEDYQFYAVSNEKRIFSIGRIGAEAHTLLVCWEADNKVIIQGYYNGEKVTLEDKKIEDGDYVKVILNLEEQKNIKILASTKDSQYLYPKKSNYENQIHRIIVFQENVHLTDIILYDSETDMLPSYIVSKDEVVRKRLKTIALSILGKYDNRLYKIFSNINSK